RDRSDVSVTTSLIRGSLVYSGLRTIGQYNQDFNKVLGKSRTHHTSSSHAYKISSYINVAPGATWRKKLTLTGSPILTRSPFCTKIWRVYLHRSLPSRLGTRYCSG